MVMNSVKLKVIYKLFVCLRCFQMFFGAKTISCNLHFPSIYTIFTWSLQKCKREVLLYFLYSSLCFAENLSFKLSV
jgi:hypothetical protein